MRVIVPTPRCAVPSLAHGGDLTDDPDVNAVTAVRDTDLGGGPTFHDTRVEVEVVPAELLDLDPTHGGEPVDVQAG